MAQHFSEIDVSMNSRSRSFIFLMNSIIYMHNYYSRSVLLISDLNILKNRIFE